MQCDEASLEDSPNNMNRGVLKLDSQQIAGCDRATGGTFWNSSYDLGLLFRSMAVR